VPEASLHSSPFKSANEESSPSPRSSDTFVTAENVQFDGAGDERPVDENKVSPRKSSTTGERPSPQRKISIMGKEAIEKVKELTTHVAKDLQTFKSKRGSPYRTSTIGPEEPSPTKQRKKSSETTSLRRDFSEESLSSLRVHAASSALDLTEENIKVLAQNASEKASEGSEHSFGSLEVNLPGSPQPLKPLMKPANSNPFAVYAGRQSLDETQNHDTNDSKATQLENFTESHLQESTASDAADTLMQVDHVSLAGTPSVVQEANAKADNHSEFTDITKVPTESKNEAQKQDDGSNG
jgi:hypothetical protein